MLDDAEKHGHQTIVSWLPHGKSFMIHDRSFFSDYFLPHYFKTKLTSFRQTLRSNGFAQMGGKGWDSGSYYHKLFVKDDPCRCQGLNPDAMKKAMPEWIHPQDEPNFYAETLAGGSSDQDHGDFSKIAEQSVELVDDPPKCNTKVPVTFLSLPKGEEAESVSAVVERKKPAAHAP